MKDVQAAGEASTPQKRPSSTSNHDIFSQFSFFVSHFVFLDPGSAYQNQQHCLKNCFVCVQIAGASIGLASGLTGGAATLTR
jgi:hypothetical protein